MENVEHRTITVQTKRFNGRKMTTYAIELRVNRRPFFVELFDSVLDGRSPSILRPYVEPRRRWDLEIWLPNREATLALRLAFRPPEGITRLNATRLNSFIQENRRSLSFKKVKSILKEWEIENWVETNLISLYRRHKVRILGDTVIIPGIDRKITKSH
jgi:hypothetical protein